MVGSVSRSQRKLQGPKKRLSYRSCYTLVFVLLMYYSIGDASREEGEDMLGSVMSCRCYLCESIEQPRGTYHRYGTFASGVLFEAGM